MLLSALVATQFIGEVSWVDNLAQTGALLIGVGIAVELASRKTGEAAYRAAIGLAVGSALLLGWVNGAVGIIGSEQNDANLMYAGCSLSRQSVRSSRASNPKEWRVRRSRRRSLRRWSP
jgi:hypothetical protein